MAFRLTRQIPCNINIQVKLVTKSGMIDNNGHSRTQNRCGSPSLLLAQTFSEEYGKKEFVDLPYNDKKNLVNANCRQCTTSNDNAGLETLQFAEISFKTVKHNAITRSKQTIRLLKDTLLVSLNQTNYERIHHLLPNCVRSHTTIKNRFCRNCSRNNLSGLIFYRLHANNKCYSNKANSSCHQKGKNICDRFGILQIQPNTFSNCRKNAIHYFTQKYSNRMKKITNILNKSTQLSLLNHERVISKYFKYVNLPKNRFYSSEYNWSGAEIMDCPFVEPKRPLDVPPLKRLKKIMHPVEKPRVCKKKIIKRTPRADDNIQYKPKKLPVISSCSCRPSAHDFPSKSVPLIPLKKGAIKEPPRGCVPPPKQIGFRADFGIQLKKKKLPILPKSECVPQQQQQLVNSSLKRLIKVDVPEPAKVCYKETIPIQPRSDHKLKVEQKMLPKMKPEVYLKVFEEPLKSVHMCRLPKFKKEDPIRCIIVKKASCPTRADDVHQYKVTVKPLPPAILKREHNSVSIYKFKGKTGNRINVTDKKDFTRFSALKSPLAFSLVTFNLIAIGYGSKVAKEFLDSRGSHLYSENAGNEILIQQTPKSNSHALKPIVKGNKYKNPQLGQHKELNQFYSPTVSKLNSIDYKSFKSEQKCAYEIIDKEMRAKSIESALIDNKLKSRSESSIKNKDSTFNLYTSSSGSLAVSKQQPKKEEVTKIFTQPSKSHDSKSVIDNSYKNGSHSITENASARLNGQPRKECLTKPSTQQYESLNSSPTSNDLCSSKCDSLIENSNLHFKKQNQNIIGIQQCESLNSSPISNDPCTSKCDSLIENSNLQFKEQPHNDSQSKIEMQQYESFGANPTTHKSCKNISGTTAAQFDKQPQKENFTKIWMQQYDLFGSGYITDSSTKNRTECLTENMNAQFNDQPQRHSFSRIWMQQHKSLDSGYIDISSRNISDFLTEGTHTQLSEQSQKENFTKPCMQQYDPLGSGSITDHSSINRSSSLTENANSQLNQQSQLAEFRKILMQQYESCASSAITHNLNKNKSDHLKENTITHYSKQLQKEHFTAIWIQQYQSLATSSITDNSSKSKSDFLAENAHTQCNKRPQTEDLTKLLMQEYESFDNGFIADDSDKNRSDTLGESTNAQFIEKPRMDDLTNIWLQQYESLGSSSISGDSSKNISDSLMEGKNAQFKEQLENSNLIDTCIQQYEPPRNALIADTAYINRNYTLLGNSNAQLNEEKEKDERTKTSMQQNEQFGSTIITDNSCHNRSDCLVENMNSQFNGQVLTANASCNNRNELLAKNMKIPFNEQLQNGDLTQFRIQQQDIFDGSSIADNTFKNNNDSSIENTNTQFSEPPKICRQQYDSLGTGSTTDDISCENRHVFSTENSNAQFVEQAQKEDFTEIWLQHYDWLEGSGNFLRNTISDNKYDNCVFFEICKSSSKLSSSNIHDPSVIFVNQNKHSNHDDNYWNKQVYEKSSTQCQDDGKVLLPNHLPYAKNVLPLDVPNVSHRSFATTAITFKDDKNSKHNEQDSVYKLNKGSFKSEYENDSTKSSPKVLQPKYPIIPTNKEWNFVEPVIRSHETFEERETFKNLTLETEKYKNISSNLTNSQNEQSKLTVDSEGSLPKVEEPTLEAKPKEKLSRKNEQAKSATHPETPLSNIEGPKPEAKLQGKLIRIDEQAKTATYSKSHLSKMDDSETVAKLQDKLASTQSKSATYSETTLSKMEEPKPEAKLQATINSTNKQAKSTPLPKIEKPKPKTKLQDKININNKQAKSAAYLKTPVPKMEKSRPEAKLQDKPNSANRQAATYSETPLPKKEELRSEGEFQHKLNSTNRQAKVATDTGASSRKMNGPEAEANRKEKHKMKNIRPKNNLVGVDLTKRARSKPKNKNINVNNSKEGALHDNKQPKRKHHVKEGVTNKENVEQQLLMVKKNDDHIKQKPHEPHSERAVTELSKESFKQALNDLVSDQGSSKLFINNASEDNQTYINDIEDTRADLFGRQQSPSRWQFTFAELKDAFSQRKKNKKIQKQQNKLQKIAKKNLPYGKGQKRNYSTLRLLNNSFSEHDAGISSVKIKDNNDQSSKFSNFLKILSKKRTGEYFMYTPFSLMCQKFITDQNNRLIDFKKFYGDVTDDTNINNHLEHVLVMEDFVNLCSKFCEAKNSNSNVYKSNAICNKSISDRTDFLNEFVKFFKDVPSDSNIASHFKEVLLKEEFATVYENIDQQTTTRNIDMKKEFCNYLDLSECDSPMANSVSFIWAPFYY